MKTQREFFAALAKCRNGWELYEGDIRRGDMFSYEPCCPVTAVAQAIMGRWYGTDSVSEAAAAIALPDALAVRIVRAADTKELEPRLRKRILAALGLEEQSNA